jgi:signal transduction histidine kinase
MIQIRSDICNAALVGMAALSLPAIIGSISRTAEIGLQPAMFFQIFVVVILWASYFARKSLPYYYRATLLIFAMYFVAITGMLQFGLLAAAGTFFVAVPILSAILFSRKFGLIMGLISICSIVVVGTLYIKGFLILDFNVGELATSSTAWINYSLSLLLVTGILFVAILISTNSLVDALSESARREKDLRDLSLDLERRVKDRTKALVQATLEARDANKAKSKFLSSVSHEIRTPLNIILGSSQILELDSKAPLTDDQSSSVQLIKSGSKQLLAVIENILNFIKINHEKTELDCKLLAANKVFKECMPIVHDLPLSEQITFHEKIVSTGKIYADHDRLQEALLCIFSNAINYNRKNGKIHYGIVGRPNNIIRFFVTDTGLGIHKNQLHNLFTPFDRLGLENLTTQGLGLGLSIAKELVESMNGTIGCESIVDQGSTFWIEFERAA